MNKLEAQALAAMLNDTDCLDAGITDIKPEWFSVPKYRAVFNKLREMYASGKHIDMVTAAQECMGIADGTEWLFLNNVLWSAGTMKYTVDRLRKNYLAKEVRRIGENMTASVKDGVDVEQTIRSVEDSLFGLSVETTDVKIVTPKEHAASMLETMGKRLDKKSNGGIATSYAGLNRALNGGFLPGQLIIIAAETGKGKTSFAMNVMRDVAITMRRSSLYVNTEMGAEQMDCRWMAILSGVPHSNIATGSMTGDEQRLVMASLDRMNESGFYSVTIPDLTIDKLFSVAKRFKARTKMEFLVVDYVGRMDTSDAKLQEWQVLKNIAKRLKTLAQETQTTVLMLAQITEAGKLEGAKGMKNECDMFIHLRDLSDKEMAKRPGFNYCLQLDKNRDNARGVIPLFFDGERLTFRGEANVVAGKPERNEAAETNEDASMFGREVGKLKRWA